MGVGAACGAETRSRCDQVSPGVLGTPSPPGEGAEQLAGRRTSLAPVVSPWASVLIPNGG